VRALARQLICYVVVLPVAVAILASVTVLSQAALSPRPSISPERIVSLAGALLFPSVLIALLTANLFAAGRGGALLLAAAAFMTFAVGRRLPPAPAPRAASEPLDVLVAPGELTRLAEPDSYLYARRVVPPDRLEDVAILSTDARPEVPHLAYAAQLRSGPGMRVGPYRLAGEVARGSLVAADESIQAVARDVSFVQGLTRGASGGGEAAIMLAGVVLAFAGTGVLVRASRWPLLGWCVALVAARGLLAGVRAASEPQAIAWARPLLGPSAGLAPAYALLAVGVLLTAAVLLLRSRRRRREGVAA
jgi:hypothetical protein